MTLHLKRFHIVGRKSLLGEEGDGAVVVARPCRRTLSDLGSGEAVSGSHHERSRTHGLGRDCVHGIGTGGSKRAHGLVGAHVHAHHALIVGVDGVKLLDRCGRKHVGERYWLMLRLDWAAKHVLGHGGS